MKRRVDEITEDIKKQLLSHHGTQSKLTSLLMLQTRHYYCFFVEYNLYQEDVHENILCALLLPTKTTAERQTDNHLEKNYRTGDEERRAVVATSGAEGPRPERMEELCQCSY